MSKYDSTNKSTRAAITAWFGQRLPEEWVAQAPQVSVDREEITVVLQLPAPAGDVEGEAPVEAAATVEDDETAAAERAEAIAGYVSRWRADTRSRRISIAREAEVRFGRKVAWGVQVADHREVFTHLAVPVMTRLGQPERQVLDTLVEAGVARSRAHALGWCVRLVEQHSEEWLAELREAMSKVAEVRESGPAA